MVHDMALGSLAENLASYCNFYLKAEVMYHQLTT
jgi:hypothetical protein